MYLRLPNAVQNNCTVVPLVRLPPPSSSGSSPHHQPFGSSPARSGQLQAESVSFITSSQKQGLSSLCSHRIIIFWGRFQKIQSVKKLLRRIYRRLQRWKKRGKEEILFFQKKHFPFALKLRRGVSVGGDYNKVAR